MASVDEYAREKAILTALKADGKVAVTDLAARFDVSTVTVRKDLEALERRSLLRRIRGGAVSVGASDEGAFEMRVRHSSDAKRAVAAAAAELVRDGDVLAMDASTTTYYLAEQLLHRRNLVVITNGLRHALLFSEQSTARVLMPGGVLRRSSASMVGPLGDVLTGRGRIRLGFFGLVGLSTQRGLMDISVEEAQTKRHLADACDEVHAVFDSSKADGFGVHAFAEPDRVTSLITDDGIGPDVVEQWRDVGVRMTAVAVPAGAPVVDLTERSARRSAGRGPRSMA